MGRLRKNLKNEQKIFLNKEFFISNLIEYKNKWNKNIFKNDLPIYLEIGSGKGSFIVSLANNFKSINFIASDKYLTILYKILTKAIKSKLENLKIINFDAKIIDSIFGDQEVDKIFLNFSDPWPKKAHSKRRLTNINFLNMYYKILKKNGTIEFKTDNEQLYEYTLEQLKLTSFKLIFSTKDLYSDSSKIDTEYKTDYEIKWLNLNKKIFKIVFCK